MSVTDSVEFLDRGLTLGDLLDDRTIEILERRRAHATPRRRGWLVKRVLLAADALGLGLAFMATYLLFGPAGSDALVLFVALPAILVLARLYGLYERDEDRINHSTADEVVGVFNMLTVGSWAVFAGAWLLDVGGPDPSELISFWAFGVGAVILMRSAGRAFCRRQLSYLQNTVILGAGDVGQLIARKFLRHPEYGINVVGFVDAEPRERADDLSHLAVLGPPEALPSIAAVLDVERILVAFSRDSDVRATTDLVRSLQDEGIQVDVVARHFELVGAKSCTHTVEGLPLVGLPPVRPSAAARLTKRAIDVLGASVGLVLASPLLVVIALRIKRDSPGPVFYRQTRLGLNRREFTLLKFRTMQVGTDATPHREYVKSTMEGGSAPRENGLYKLERNGDVTRVGSWLRRSNLDELPQLINVLKGEMSLVGPRPCIPYETDNFLPHHFDRFRVPAGLTGLWQVTARARSTYGEALEFDVSYARNWSLGLDLSLLLRTIRELAGSKGTA